MGKNKGPMGWSFTPSNVSFGSYGQSPGTPPDGPHLDDPEQGFKQAQELFNQGKVEQAKSLCGSIVEMAPGHSRALHMLGYIALKSRRPKEALEKLTEAARHPNDNPLLFLHLGVAQGVDGMHDKAEESFNKAVELKADLPDAHFNLGLTLRIFGRHEEAARSFRAVLEHAPNHISAIDCLGTELMVMGKMEEAIQSFDRALEINPDFVSALNNKGNALIVSDHVDGAISLLERAVELSPGVLEPQLNLGKAYLDGRSADKAIAAFEKAIEIQPDHVDALVQLALTLEKDNRFEQAREVAEKIFRLDANSYMAHLTLARCDMQMEYLERARERLEELRKRKLEDKEYSMVSTTLGHVFDRLGEPEIAYRYFSQANDRNIRSEEAARIDKENFPALIRANREGFTASMVGKWPKRIVCSDRGAPIFFVGFPRSGTTLMERMLNVHSGLVSEGEHGFLLELQKSIPAPLAETLDSFSDTDVARLRIEYWNMAEAVYGDILKDKRMIDKLPLNIVHLGLVRRIFPEAKVLVALRDPRDCVLSCFMQNFELNPSMVHFLTMEGCAGLYTEVMDLWLHYREVLDVQWLEYRYEDLVADPKASVSKVLDFLGLPWEEAVLDRRKRQQGLMIDTPSRSAVSQPITERAKGRWARYESQMAGVLESLAPFVEEFGYTK